MQDRLDQKKLDNFYRVLMTMVGMLILAITFIVIVDISGRTLAAKPLIGAVDISRLLLSFILFLGLSYALRRGAHVRVTILYNRFSPRALSVIEILVFLGGFALLSLLAYCSWDLFWDSWLVRETMRSPIDLPRWLAKLALFAGSTLFAAQFAFDLVGHIRKLHRRGGND